MTGAGRWLWIAFLGSATGHAMVYVMLLVLSLFSRPTPQQGSRFAAMLADLWTFAVNSIWITGPVTLAVFLIMIALFSRPLRSLGIWLTAGGVVGFFVPALFMLILAAVQGIAGQAVTFSSAMRIAGYASIVVGLPVAAAGMLSAWVVYGRMARTTDPGG